MSKILCPKCLLVEPGTKHHIYPKRFFDPQGCPLVYLCRKCHDALERIIPQNVVLEKEDYLQLTQEFLAF